MSLNGAHTNHGLIWIHKTYHDQDLKIIITFIVMYFVASHGGCSQIVIFHETSKQKSQNCQIMNLVTLGLYRLYLYHFVSTARALKGKVIALEKIFSMTY
jgi:hypothetical protein